MKSKYFTSLVVMATSAFPMVVHAADNKELNEIREQIKQLKQSCETRIQELESRLQQAETKAQNAEAAASQATAKAESAEKLSASTSTTPASSTQTSKGIAAFNPATSLVLQGRYANLSQDPNNYRISGFLPGGEIGPGKRGFGLSETEVTMSANVDDKFFGQATLSVTPENEIGVEEAYALTNSLPAGVSVKAGRFFSGIGYQNEQHQHAWDFVDAPLAYQAFLGGQFGNDGVQFKWVAPTNTFFELGAEIGSGENFPGTARNKNGSNASALTAKWGGDIGYSTSWSFGLSGLRTHAQNREFNETDISGNDSVNAFSGKSSVGIVDFVVKYAPNGNPLVTNFKLQGEYFKRKEDGLLAYDSNGALGLTSLDTYRSSQSGWYLQGVYQFMPRWRVGFRYDRLDRGTIDLASNGANLDFANFNPHKSTLMFDWSPSEFSRWRLQLARDQSQAGLTDNQLLLQYIMTLGAHGAHKY